MNSEENKKEKRQLLNLILENSREYDNFENGVTQTPTWHQILKPIRMLTAIFYGKNVFEIFNKNNEFRRK